MTLHQNRSLSGLKSLAIAVVLIGIFFRVTHLGHKVYWHDEVFTSMQTAGYTATEVDDNVFTGVLLAPKQLLHYQHLSPHRGWDKTWYALSSDPVHPPLYYLIERLWMEWFGSTVITTRSLSVLFSLLTFPALYWLCQELFDLSTVGWIALALFAVSPFQVLYAQEARPYSLWILVTLLSSSALLQALRRQTWTNWAGYAATVALMLNTFILSPLVLVCHGLMILLDRPLSGRALRYYGLALFVGCLSFVPWMIVLMQNWLNLQSKTAWTTSSPPQSVLFKLWGLHLSSNFIDPGFPLEHPYTYIVPPLVGGLFGYGLWLLCRHTQRRTWLLLLLLTTLPAIALMLPDLLWGGQRSINTRYFVPGLVGVQLTVAYGLASLIENGRSRQRLLGKVILALLLTAGMVSCALSWQSETWWTKGTSYNNSALAKSLNQLDQPIVIRTLENTALGDTISLSYLVNDDVRFILVK
jgi:uncharacterized membrane protein